MRKIIVYYSRTGTSKRIAEKISKLLGIEIVEIKDKNNYKGVFGYLKGGFFASRWRKVDYFFESKLSFDEYTHIYFISPIWASKIAPAIYSFLMDNDLNKKSIILTNDGSNPKKTFVNIEKKFGAFDNKYCITKAKKNEDEIINLIIKENSW